MLISRLSGNVAAFTHWIFSSPSHTCPEPLLGSQWAVAPLAPRDSLELEGEQRWTLSIIPRAGTAPGCAHWSVGPELALCQALFDMMSLPSNSR